MDKKLWEEVDGKQKPPAKGHYHTDMGNLYWDGAGFVVPGHKRLTYTSVRWWLRPYSSITVSTNP